jgi:hypothetical protein
MQIPLDFLQHYPLQFHRRKASLKECRSQSASFVRAVSQSSQAS